MVMIYGYSIKHIMLSIKKPYLTKSTTKSNNNDIYISIYILHVPMNISTNILKLR